MTKFYDDSKLLTIPLSDEAARQWAEQHLDADAVELARKLAARMGVEHCSRNEIILRALQDNLK